MRRGFTLIELMVVAGIMAFLGTAATGGYNAFQRGMAERGATGAASSLLKAAKERAFVDRTATMVFCYNRLLREATDDENAIVVGEAVAIRRAGRITHVDGEYLIDEFADILGSYDVVEDSAIQDRSGIRLWKFDDVEMSQADYSVIADAVTPYDPGNSYLQTYEGWAFGENNNPDAVNASADLSTEKPKNGNRKVVTLSGGMKCLLYAFRDLGKGTIQAGTWKVGNGYGFEFAHVQLPHDFIFNGSIPTRLGEIANVRVMYFDPWTNDGDKTIDVYACMPDASGKPQKNQNPAGTATSKGS